MENHLTTSWQNPKRLLEQNKVTQRCSSLSMCQFAGDVGKYMFIKFTREFVYRNKIYIPKENSVWVYEIKMFMHKT